MYEAAGADLEIVFWIAVMLGWIALWLAVLFVVQAARR